MKNFSGKNILVTGGTGFIGSHLIEELIKHNANIISTFQTLNPFSYFFTQKLDKEVRLFNLDICDYEKLFDLITKFDTDYIFHLAAQPLVEVALHNPKRTLYSNIIGTVNICESTRLFPKIKGLIIASSDKAYGKLKKDKYLETDGLKGDHPYEVSKSAADLIASSYFKTYQAPIVISRFGNIYGEGDLNYSRIIPGLMKSLLKSEIFKVRSNGKHIRDYLYVKDVVHGYLLLAANIEKIKGEIFNFGSEETLSVLEVLKLTEKVLNKKIRYQVLNITKNEIPYQSLDYSKIKKVLGWFPQKSLSSTLNEMFNWYKKTL